MPGMLSNSHRNVSASEISPRRVKAIMATKKWYIPHLYPLSQQKCGIGKYLQTYAVYSKNIFSHLFT